MDHFNLLFFYTFGILFFALFPPTFCMDFFLFLSIFANFRMEYFSFNSFSDMTLHGCLLFSSAKPWIPTILYYSAINIFILFCMGCIFTFNHGWKLHDNALRTYWPININGMIIGWTLRTFSLHGDLVWENSPKVIERLHTGWTMQTLLFFLCTFSIIFLCPSAFFAVIFFLSYCSLVCMCVCESEMCLCACVSEMYMYPPISASSPMVMSSMMDQLEILLYKIMYVIYVLIK